MENTAPITFLTAPNADRSFAMLLVTENVILAILFCVIICGGHMVPQTAQRPNLTCCQSASFSKKAALPLGKSLPSGPDGR